MGTHPSPQEQARGPQQAGRGTRHGPRGRGVRMHLAELPMAQTPGGAEPGRRRPPPGLLGPQPSCPHSRTHGRRCRTLGLGDVSPAMFLL